jgi:hypothetical protein
MALTYEPIASTTLGTGAATIDLASIPTTYTDLKIIFTGITASGDTLEMRFNNNSNANYSRVRVSGDGSATATGRNAVQTRFSIGDIYSTQPFFIECDVMGYAGSNRKTMLYTHSLDRNGNGEIIKGACLWNATAAITEVNFFTASANNFNAGTTISVYGILKA